jgi:hypothetical protein
MFTEKLDLLLQIRDNERVTWSAGTARRSTTGAGVVVAGDGPAVAWKSGKCEALAAFLEAVAAFLEAVTALRADEPLPHPVSARPVTTNRTGTARRMIKESLRCEWLLAAIRRGRQET